MVDISLPSKGNIRLRWYPAGSFANEQWPTVAELNAGQELEQVVAWDGFEGLVQSSDTTERTHLAAKATQTRRGAANYGGNLSFDYPGYKADNANAAALVYQALGARFNQLNVGGYLGWSIDGEIGEAGQPPANLTFEDGDYVNLIKVITDEWTDEITGEEDFSYTRNFLKYGGLWLYTVASTAAPVLAATADGSQSIGVGDVLSLTATVNGREWSRGVRWSSDDSDVATVSRNAIVSAVATGPAVITATLPGITPAVTDTVSVTVA